MMKELGALGVLCIYLGRSSLEIADRDYGWWVMVGVGA
jgi:hypothetical protein